MPSRALYIDIGETTTRLASSSSRRRSGVNIGGRGAAPASPVARCANHAFEVGDVVAVAQAQVLVADALAARQQRVGELLGLEREVARQALEPLHRVARRRLQPHHLELARGLVAREDLRQRAAAEAVGEVDRVLHRQPRARPDREVRGVRGVAEQHDVVAVPALAVDPRELQPDRRAAQVRGVGAQPGAVEEVGEELLAARDRLRRSPARRSRARARSRGRTRR